MHGIIAMARYETPSGTDQSQWKTFTSLPLREAPEKESFKNPYSYTYSVPTRILPSHGVTISVALEPLPSHLVPSSWGG